MELRYEEIPDYVLPTNIRISTITVMIYINRNIVFNEFFELIPTIEYGEIGITKMKLFEKDEEKRITVHEKTSNGIVKYNVRKCFQNQVTIDFGFLNSNNEYKSINIFCFKEGTFKLAGFKSEEDIQIGSNELIKYIERNRRQIMDDDTTISTLFVHSDESVLKIEELRTIMFNTDFCVNFKLLRDVLFEMVCSEYNLVLSEYEPDIYPGVKIRYFYNKKKERKIKGICTCTSQCNGKGNGDGNGKCKMGTISVFQSGKIIITGANSYNQVLEMYEFINKVLKENYEKVIYREPILESF